MMARNANINSGVGMPHLVLRAGGVFALSLALCSLTACVKMPGFGSSTEPSEPGVKVSERFGYDPVDATRFVKAALTSGEKHIIFDRKEGGWNVMPLNLKGRSDLTITFEDGAYLVAKRGEYHRRNDCLLQFVRCTNIVLRGTSPERCGLKMWFEDYYNTHNRDPKTKNEKGYVWSEWRHGISLLSCVNVALEGISSNASGGDGLYVSTSSNDGGHYCENVTVRNCIFDGNNRQGISVIGVRGFLAEDVIMSNTRGTAPAAGIDFEPNKPYEEITGVVMRRCKAFGNVGSGFEFYLGQMDGTSVPVDALFEDCVAFSNRNNFAVGTQSGSLKPFNVGLIELRRCRLEHARESGIRYSDRPFGSGRLLVRDTVLKDNGLNSTNIPEIVLSVRGHVSGEPNVYEFDNVKVLRSRLGRVIPKTSRTTPFSGKPSLFRGSLESDICGKCEKVVFDDRWNATNHPYKPNAEKPVPRIAAPLDNVTVIDACPDKMVEVGNPIFYRSGKRPLVFYADRAKEVSFKMQQTRIGKNGFDAPKKPIGVVPFGSKEPLKGVSAKVPDDPNGSVVKFRVPRKGFYTLDIATGGNGLAILATDVPVAYDVRDDFINFVGPAGGRVAKYRNGESALYFEVPAGATFAVQHMGESFEMVGLAIMDPSGKTVRRDASLADINSLVVENAAGGVWSVRAFKPAEGAYEDFNISLSGVRGWYFLTPEKRWK